jgi:hypothetical protein
MKDEVPLNFSQRIWYWNIDVGSTFEFINKNKKVVCQLSRQSSCRVSCRVAL